MTSSGKLDTYSLDREVRLVKGTSSANVGF